MSGHETPRSFGGMHTPVVAQCIAPDSESTFEKWQIFGGDQGAAPPVTPLIPI